MKCQRISAAWIVVGPSHGDPVTWIVLGWRIGQAALREFKSQWGQHELEVVCYVPPQLPFT